MNKQIIQDLIDDILQAPKYQDGTLRNEEKIIEKYLENWEEEFEDEIIYDNDTGYEDEGFWEWYELENNNLSDLLEKYFGDGCKVKIKIRKGKIVIERR